MAQRQSKQNPKKPHGQLRQSQMLTTYGPGSLLDLPKHSVIVGGTQTWYSRDRQNRPKFRLIVEERLANKVRWFLQEMKPGLQLPSMEFRAPPAGSADPEEASRSGVTVFQFPEWFVSRDFVKTSPFKSGQVRRLEKLNGIDLKKREFTSEDKVKLEMIPVRFVRSCRNGHIGDIRWREYINCEGQSCFGRPLYLIERGTTGDVAEMEVGCECGNRRKLSDATNKEAKVLGKCDGARPWLGQGREDCPEFNRLLIRTSSSSYFPQLLTVITIPDDKRPIREAMYEHFPFFKDTTDFADFEACLNYGLRDAKRKADLGSFQSKDLFNELQLLRKSPASRGGPNLKLAEFQVLADSRPETGTDAPDGDFFARTLPSSGTDSICNKYIEKIVLVHRLREVSAMVGFSRFNAISPNKDGELEVEETVTLAMVGPDYSWLPAIENRGEGVFIQLKSARVAEWRKRPKVQQRAESLASGLKEQSLENGTKEADFSGVEYYMLHSLSHLLITAISLECGYPASSIKERIYSLTDESEGLGYGILLYTSTSDAEGTMGGLIQAGRHIERHLQSALQMAKLCSNDPVCAQHIPNNKLEKRFMLGAACHGCLLIAETSCERRNECLDRSLLVGTVGTVGNESIGAEFFTDLV
jgi:hypothetical protein